MFKKCISAFLVLACMFASQSFAMQDPENPTVNNYIVYNNTPDAIIEIGDTIIGPNEKNILVHQGGDKIRIDFTPHTHVLPFIVTAVPSDYVVSLNKLPIDREDEILGFPYQFISTNLFTGALQENIIAIEIHKKLIDVTQLNPIEKESVKHWLLVDQRLRPFTHKDLKRPIAHKIIQLLAQDLLERVINTGALIMLEKAQRLNDAETIQILKNYLDLTFLEGVVRNQIAEQFGKIPRTVEQSFEKALGSWEKQ